MARIQPIYTPADHPSTDAETKQQVADFFESVYPGYAGMADKPDLSGAKSGWAVVLHNPKIAKAIKTLSLGVINDLAWTQRKDLRELAVQTLNLHFHCTSSFEAHLPVAESVGISLQQQAAIPYWDESTLFNDEQRLVIEYTEAVVTGFVPEELMERMVDAFGETQAVEASIAIANWSFWAMILGAAKP